eukprot:scaffold21543_cov76-Amphora_coffeaeformis.AAC.1
MDSNQDFLQFLANVTKTYEQVPGMATHFPSSPAVGSHDRRSEPLKKGGSLNKIKFLYGPNSCYLAPKPGLSPDADRETKAMVLDDMVAETQGSFCTWKEKVLALTGHYNNQVVATTAKAAIGTC